MTQLKDFESKDFVEQVSILGMLAQDKDYESIPEIVNLIPKISRNDAVGHVLRNTLKTLLLGSEDHTVRFLISDNPEVREICMDVAGQKKYLSAGKALLDMACQAYEEKNNRMLFTALSSLDQVKPDGCLDLFRKCIDHEDPLVSSLCIDFLGDALDTASFGRFCDIVSLAESDAYYEECDLPTASAVRALGKFKGQEVVPFLISRIHHRNPSARRLIHQELAAFGSETVKPLSAVFASSNVDERILAANILGLIGTKEAGDALVSALDKGRADHANIRFAIYDALGKTSGMAGLVCLVDALEEADQMVLMAVISSLDLKLNPWIIDKIAETVRKNDDHSRMLIRAVISSKSSGIFEGLYLKDDDIGKLLIHEIVHSGDGEIISFYAEKLKETGKENADADLKMLENAVGKSAGQHILAVDDSRAMLNFYRSVASSMGLCVSTAENGKDALDKISSTEEFRLILTDMNMPVMDGIELIRQLRHDPIHAGVPVVMITTESEGSQEDLARKAGATAFLRKPFGAEKLQATIKTYLEQGRVADYRETFLRGK